MNEGAEKMQETDVNEIRNLMEECHNCAQDISGKVMELHHDPEPDKPNVEAVPLPGPIGPEFIQRMKDLRNLLRISFATLKRFC